MSNLSLIVLLAFSALLCSGEQSLLNFPKTEEKETAASKLVSIHDVPPELFQESKNSVGHIFEEELTDEKEMKAEDQDEVTTVSQIPEGKEYPGYLSELEEFKEQTETTPKTFPDEKDEFSSQLDESLFAEYLDQSKKQNSRNWLEKTWDNIKELRIFSSSLNMFRLVADSAHLVAILMLLFKILMNKSCDEISWKSQLLYTLVFTTRYVDLFTDFISVYNSGLKSLYLALSSGSLLLTLIKFKTSDDRKYDTFCIGYLIVPAALLAVRVNHEMTVMELLWTFSIYLEAVAIVPQMFLLIKKDKMETTTLLYLITLGSYRALYICNWVHRYNTEEFFDPIAFAAGIVQTSIYVLFFLYFGFIRRWCVKQNKKRVGVFFVENLDDKVPIMAYA